MPDNPEDLKYSKEHEWVRIEEQEDGRVEGVIGITLFAQDSLGDVALVDIPTVGDIVYQSEKMGEIESVKTVSDLFSPVSGSVIGNNDGVLEHPEWVNEEPYGRGWLIRGRLEDPSQLDKLLTSSEYDEFLASLP